MPLGAFPFPPLYKILRPLLPFPLPGVPTTYYSGTREVGCEELQKVYNLVKPGVILSWDDL